MTINVKTGPNQLTITFDKDKTKRLHAAYDQAVATQAEIIEFDGLQMVTGYAKYLLEYLDNRLAQ